MLVSSRAISLSSIKYGDNSLISKLYSEEFGFISVISSIRKNKKYNLKQYFDPLNCIQVSIYYQNTKELHRLKEVGFAFSSYELSSVVESIKQNSQRFFLAEFLSKILNTSEKDDRLFSFLWEKSKALLNAEKSQANFHLLFLWELSEIMGVAPQVNSKGNYYDFAEAQFVEEKPSHSNFEENNIRPLLMILREEGNLNHKQRQALIRFFLNHFEYQFGGLSKLKSLSVLESVLS